MDVSIGNLRKLNAALFVLQGETKNGNEAHLLWCAGDALRNVIRNRDHAEGHPEYVQFHLDKAWAKTSEALNH